MTRSAKPWRVGTRVRKTTGYCLDGEIRAAFTTRSGKRRYVVEHMPLAPGLLHIYAPRNLRRVRR